MSEVVAILFDRHFQAENHAEVTRRNRAISVRLIRNTKNSGVFTELKGLKEHIKYSIDLVGSANGPVAVYIDDKHGNIWMEPKGLETKMTKYHYNFICLTTDLPHLHIGCITPYSKLSSGHFPSFQIKQVIVREIGRADKRDISRHKLVRFKAPEKMLTHHRERYQVPVNRRTKANPEGNPDLMSEIQSCQLDYNITDDLSSNSVVEKLNEKNKQTQATVDTDHSKPVKQQKCLTKIGKPRKPPQSFTHLPKLMVPEIANHVAPALDTTQPIEVDPESVDNTSLAVDNLNDEPESPKMLQTSHLSLKELRSGKISNKTKLPKPKKNIVRSKIMRNAGRFTYYADDLKLPINKNDVIEFDQLKKVADHVISGSNTIIWNRCHQLKAFQFDLFTLDGNVIESTNPYQKSIALLRAPHLVTAVIRRKVIRYTLNKRRYFICPMDQRRYLFVSRETKTRTDQHQFPQLDGIPKQWQSITTKIVENINRDILSNQSAIDNSLTKLFSDDDSSLKWNYYINPTFNRYEMIHALLFGYGYINRGDHSYFALRITGHLGQHTYITLSLAQSEGTDRSSYQVKKISIKSKYRDLLNHWKTNIKPQVLPLMDMDNPLLSPVLTSLIDSDPSYQFYLIQSCWVDQEVPLLSNLAAIQAVVLGIGVGDLPVGKCMVIPIKNRINQVFLAVITTC